MPEKPQLVLHLGAHKTGTSLIQNFMISREQDLARAGVGIITRSMCSQVIGWGELPTRDPELLRQAVVAASSTGKLPEPRKPRNWLSMQRGSETPPIRIVAASHENSLGRPFSASTPGMYPSALACAQGLSASVRDFPTRIVYYIRSQDEFIESYYLQTVHQGATHTFQEWVADIDLDSISWVPVVRALHSAFGADRVVVRDFAEIASGQNRFLSRFLLACDESLEMEVEYKHQANISVSQLGLDLALTMNPLLTTTKQRRATRKFLQHNFNNTTGPRPLLLTESVRAALKARYAAENSTLTEPLEG